MQKVFLVLVNLIIIGVADGFVYGAKKDAQIIWNMQYSAKASCQPISATQTNTSMFVPKTPIGRQNITFLLYTSDKPDIEETCTLYSTVEDIRKTNLNFSCQTIIYLHGLNMTYYEPRDAFRKNLLPHVCANVFIVNWDKYAEFRPDAYSRVITIPRLGNLTALFVNKLIQAGVDPKLIHLIGFSAGGQAIGLAGKLTIAKVGRISAYDPEGSCFNFLPPSKRIYVTDADYVQIVHCTIGLVASTFNVVGHSTFYVNNALTQFQCNHITSSIMKESQCCHMQCQKYLFNSLKADYVPYTGVGCASIDEFKKGICNGPHIAPLMYNVPTNYVGLYFVNTEIPTWFSFNTTQSGTSSSGDDSGDEGDDSDCKGSHLDDHNGNEENCPGTAESSTSTGTSTTSSPSGTSATYGTTTGATAGTPEIDGIIATAGASAAASDSTDVDVPSGTDGNSEDASAKHL